MKCLVTGATGFIGRELCRHLAAAGDEFVAYSFSGQQLDDGTSTKAIDLRRESPTPAELAWADAVFHLAGIAHQQAPDSDYQQVNHQAVVKLAREASEAGVKQFIFISSVKAMGAMPGEKLRDESDAVLPHDAYGLSKWMAESALNREFGGGDMSVGIIRPALVYGPAAKGNLQRLERGVELGLPRPPADGGRSMIGVSDLCRLMMTLAGEGQAGVSTYIATDGQVYNMRRIYDALRRVRGKGVGRAWWPRWLWRGLCALQDWRNPVQERAWLKLFGTELYSNELVLRSTSWRPAQCLEKCLQQEGSP